MIPKDCSNPRNSRAKRIAVIMFTIFPWNIPLFSRLNREKDLEFRFFFGSTRTKRRIWKSNDKNISFSYTLLKTIAINSKREKFVSIDIWPNLKKFNPDVIIGYGFGLTILQALFYALLNIKKMVIWGEMPLQLEKRRHLLLRLYRKSFARACAAGLASSLQTRNFFRSIKLRNIYLAPLTVDGVNVEEVPGQKYCEKSGPFRILYVGSIEYRKGIDLLLETFEQVQRMVDRRLVLRIIGNTNIEPDYINKLVLYRRNPSIEFVGFTDDIAKYYLEAHLFALFTRRDAHAMVVPEAMSYGLPIICSKYAGCVDDFVKDNGRIIDPYRIQENAEMMSQLIMNPATLRQMAEYSLGIIKNKSNKQSSEEIVKMLNEI